MTRNTKVTFKAGECSALSTQSSGIYPYGFPFMLDCLVTKFLIIKIGEIL